MLNKSAWLSCVCDVSLEVLRMGMDLQGMDKVVLSFLCQDVERVEGAYDIRIRFLPSGKVFQYKGVNTEEWLNFLDRFPKLFELLLCDHKFKLVPLVAVKEKNSFVLEYDVVGKKRTDERGSFVLETEVA